MDAIEPHWISLLWFAAFATICMLAFLDRRRHVSAPLAPGFGAIGTAALLIAGNAVLLAALLTGTVFYGYAELRWSSLIVVAGLVVLFAPGLFEVWPSSLRDGRDRADRADRHSGRWRLRRWRKSQGCPCLGKPVAEFNRRMQRCLSKSNSDFRCCVVIVAAIACYFQHMLGHDRIQYVVAFLGCFMIFAMWLFPEVKREERAK